LAWDAVVAAVGLGSVEGGFDDGVVFQGNVGKRIQFSGGFHIHQGCPCDGDAGWFVIQSRFLFASTEDNGAEEDQARGTCGNEDEEFTLVQVHVGVRLKAGWGADRFRVNSYNTQTRQFSGVVLKNFSFMMVLSMSQRSQEKYHAAACWLDLKKVWEAWQLGSRTATLMPASQTFFEEQCGRLFRVFLGQLGSAFEGVPRPVSDAECWSHVLTHLISKRPLTGRTELDDLFQAGFEKARANNPGKEIGLITALGWISNQFEMRVRNAVRNYVREYGTRSAVMFTDRLDANLQEDEAGDARTKGDLLVSPEVAPGERVAQIQQVAIVTPVVEEVMNGATAAAKLSLFLRSLRERGRLIISVASPEVRAVSGLGHASFAEAFKSIRKTLMSHLSEREPYAKAAADEKDEIAVAAMRQTVAQVEDWFWEGRWIDDFAAAPVHRGLSQREFMARIKGLLDLIRSTLLKTKQNLVPEKELDRLFNLLEERIKRPAPTGKPLEK
jgi:hypothetical protein